MAVIVMAMVVMGDRGMGVAMIVVVLDGIALYNSSGTQGLTGAVLDFPQSPDVISEFQVLTSNYDAQYGRSGGGVIAGCLCGSRDVPTNLATAKVRSQAREFESVPAPRRCAHARV